ncbi:MAG: cupin domain-containing protein, partial [Gammaproteobacteria bacterium]|nr:cupin domain-containing protein [Gammaproteobacteria bacterium]
ISTTLNKIPFNKKDIEIFLGKFLTEPKPHIFFSSPNCPLSKKKFILKAKTHGIRLGLKSQLLFTKNMLFMNGEVQAFVPTDNDPIIKLANEYEIPPYSAIPEKNNELLYEWYLAGYIEIKPWKK